MRRNGIARGVCLGLLAALAVASAHAESLAKAVDGFAKDVIDTNRTAALNVAIDKDGKMLLDKGYGFANLEKKIKAMPDTVYRIGSVTKQFTAVAIIQLERGGKLKLDDSITTILADYPAPPKTITVKNLLQHTSGIPNFTNLPSYVPNMSKDVTHADMIARFDALPLDFDPGSKWNYSNSGYYLLGMIVEKVSGESYADYLAKHVFAPAGLKHTTYEIPGTERAEGYRRNDKTLSVAGPISMTQPFSAGALVSTANDLVHWTRALVEQRMDPPDALDRLTSDVVRTAPEGSETYGYGIGVSTKDGKRVISHGGGINGFGSLLAYYPDSGYTIALLSNTEGLNLGGFLGRITDFLDKNATDGDKKKGN